MNDNQNIPLAERMRPNSIDQIIGQSHLIGKNAVLSKSVESGLIPSMILWGPPGIGKTTMALVIAQQSKRDMYTLSAINSGVKDIRDVIDKAKNKGLFGTDKPILFIDEIHRFSKSQQDSLLGAVEQGILTLIGATTENPSFEVIPALLSRCQVYILEALNKNDLTSVLQTALENDKVLKARKINLKETDALLRFSGGDVRKLLNGFEVFINSFTQNSKIELTNEVFDSVIQQNPILYDKTGEQHYDIISAFIKSIRGSDPNAAVYWLARMIEGGEDPKFIARRLIISASEDIGNANPNALVLANSCFQSVATIGYPECRIVLSQTVIYLATSPKSNASYAAINDAQQLVKSSGNLAIPLHLRNAPTKLMKELNYGKDYVYSHNYEGNFKDQEYLPKELSNTKLYEPGNNIKENSIRLFLKKLWNKKYNY